MRTPKCRVHSSRQRGRGPAAVLGAGGVPQRLLARGPAAAPVAGERAERGEAGGPRRRGSTPTQLMPAPQTTATPRGSATPARSRAKVSLPTSHVARPARAGERRRAARSSSTGRSASGQVGGDVVAPAGPPAARSSARRATGRPSASSAAADARPLCGAKPGRRARCRAPRRPAPTRATSVLLLPPSTASDAVGHVARPRAGTRGCARAAGRSGSLGRVVLADQRVGEQRVGRPGRGRRAARPRARGPRTPVTCAISPAYSGSSGADRQRRGARRRSTVARHLDHRVVGQERQRAVVADVHHLDVAGAVAEQRRRPGRPRPPSSTRRRAAPAAPACRRASGRRTCSSSSRLDLRRPRRPATALARCSRHHLVVRVEVAQVVRRDDAAGGRARSGGSSRSAAISSPCSASSSGSTVARRPTQTARSQVRWLSPTWSSVDLRRARRRAGRRSGAGSRSPRCTARPPGARRRSSARVTMPTGLVKSMIQASGLRAPDPLGDVEHDRDRAQRLGQAAGAGGLLADAAALQRQRLVLIAGRLPADAQLEQHGVGAVQRRRPGRWCQRSGAGCAVRGEDPARRTPPTSSSRSAAGSTRTSSSTGSASRSRAKPSISSGVYVEPPPTTATSSSLDSCQRDALRRRPSGRRRTAGSPGAMTSTVAAMVRFQSRGAAPGTTPARARGSRLLGFSLV